MAEEGNAAVAAPADGKVRTSFTSYALKAAVTTLGGGVLTACIAMAQLSYSRHLDGLQRQSQYGVAFQENVLTLTGRLEMQMTQIITELRQANSNDPAQRTQHLTEADRLYREALAPLMRQWESEKLLLRNRGAQIYGAEVGDAIYNLPDDAEGLDSCSVVSPADTPEPADCGASVGAEVTALTNLVRSVRRGADLSAFRRRPHGPMSFAANLGLADAALYRSIVCLRFVDDPRRPSRCHYIQQALDIAAQRVEMVGLARESLADLIVDNSTLAN